MPADTLAGSPARWKALVAAVVTSALLAAAGATYAPPAGAQWAATWAAKTWPASPPTGVGARGWIDMVFDDVAGRSVLFGGSGELYMNDVWFYDSAADTWTEVEPSVPCWALNDHVPPTPRDEHAVEYDSFNRLYWSVGGSGFGCKGSARTAGAGSGPTTVVDGALSSPAVDFYKDWTVEVISTVQKAYVSAYDPVTKTLTLATAISALTPGTQYYLYPQRGGGTWYYSPVTQAWGSLSGPHWGYTGPSPSSRYSPAMAYSPPDRAIILFGGEPNDNDTWMLDVQTRTWVRKLPVGAPGSPPPLRQVTNSMVYDAANDVFILFGGRCGPCATYESSDETWAYRLSTNTWTNLTPPLRPPARQQHTMAYDSDNGVIVLFGGNDSASGVHFDDLWIFDTAAGTWTQLFPPVSPPSRRLHAMVYDPVNRVTVMYGGADPAGSRRDVWHLSLTRTTSGNPVPVLASLTPTSAVQGGGAFTLTVNGTGFISTSIVRWDGADRATTYVSPAVLQAAIPAGDLTTEGTAAVTVFNPAPGGGTSNPLTFTITPPAAGSPDLTIEALALDAGTAPAGGWVQATYTVLNRGTVGVTEGYAERIYLAPTPTLGGDAVLLGTTQPQATDLGAGEGIGTTAGVQIPAATAPGTYYVLVQADALAGVAEGNEGNNVSAVPLSVTPVLDCPQQIVIDNLDPGATSGTVSFTGTWAMAALPGGYGGDSLESAGPGVDTYTWTTPVLSSAGYACRYRVAVSWVEAPTRGTAVPYTVNGQTGGPVTRTYDQRNPGGQFLEHGVYTFPPGAQGTVTVTDEGGLASADAVWFSLDGAAYEGTTTAPSAAKDRKGRTGGKPKPRSRR